MGNRATTVRDDTDGAEDAPGTLQRLMRPLLLGPPEEETVLSHISWLRKLGPRGISSLSQESLAAPGPAPAV